MSGQPENTVPQEKPFVVRRGRVNSVDLYEVKENELEILENGDPNSIHLNFAIFLLSLSFSSILAISTATFSNPLVENSFLFVFIIGLIGGFYLLILWKKGRKSIKSIIQNIKKRIPPDTYKKIEDQKADTEPEINSESDLETPKG